MMRIVAPHFVAGVVISHGVVVRAAPIVKYMKGWLTPKVINYCKKRGWSVVTI